MKHDIDTEILPDRDKVDCTQPMTEQDAKSKKIIELTDEKQELLQRLENSTSTLMTMTKDVIKGVDTQFTGHLRKLERKPLVKILTRLRQIKKMIDSGNKMNWTKNDYDDLQTDVNDLFRKVLDIQKPLGFAVQLV